MRQHTTRLAILVLGIASITPHALAVNKEMVQLQEQVTQLQDSVSKLQQFNEERMGTLTTLLQQTADSVTKMSATVQSLQTAMNQQQSAEGSKVDQISGQIQSLNDSVDELKARLDKITKQMSDLQSQTESISAAMHPDAGGGAGAISGPGAGMSPVTGTGQTGSPMGTGAPNGKPSAAIPADGTDGAAVANTSASAAPPVDQLYQTAYGDFMAAKYQLSAAEFGDVVHFYPDNVYAGSAHFYLGEIAYKQGHYAAAIKEFNNVIDNFPGHNKIPAAELHKGFGELALKQTSAGEHELRLLIQRYPNSPEATAAHNRLNAISGR